MSEEPDKLMSALSPERGETIKWIIGEFNVSIITALLWRIAAPWSLPVRRVDDSFFMFPVNGTVKVTSEGTVLYAAPGEFIMLRDNAEHRVELAEGCGELEMIAIHCHIANIWKVPLLNYFDHQRGILKNRQADLLELSSFVSFFNANNLSGQKWGSNLIKSLLVNEVLNGAEVRDREEQLDHRISRSILKIHDFYARDITVESLAADCRLSLVQFRKLFKMHIGIGPKKYLIQYRLNVSRRMLQETDLSLKEIASLVGFRSVQYFHSVFRVNYKCTPNEFRFRSQSI